MSAHFGASLNNVRVADRQHVNPMLEGILYSTDRKAQVTVLQNESRRTSAASTPATSRKNSIISPDAASVASFSSEKRRKSFFGMASFGKSNRGVVATPHAL